MIQTQFLNYLLDSKDSSLITLNNLSEKYFSDCKSEFLFIKNHFELYGNIPDKETFLKTFPNFKVMSVGETSQYLIKSLYDEYSDRQLALSFNKVRDLLMSGKSAEAREYYMNIGNTISDDLGIQCVDILKDTSRYDEYVARTQEFGKYYISTGFKELDAVVGGWDREEELATIVARTNQGKSQVAIKCAVAAAKQGLKVGIYSGEMTERKVGYRIDTMLGHMNNGGIVHGNIKYASEYKQYINSLPTLVSGSIKVLTAKSINGPATVDVLRAFILKENLDILFVDQLSLLEDQRHGRTAVEKMSNISKDLKNLQVMCRKPIISVCQQNRTATDSGEQDTTQIAQSDRIGQDSTMIIFLEQIKDKEDKKKNKLVLSLVKSRDSENGKKLSYYVDFNVGTFTYIPDENDATLGSGSGNVSEEDIPSNVNDLETRYAVPDEEMPF